MKWIKVADRLPEKSGKYFAYGKSKCLGNCPEIMLTEASYKSKDNSWEFGEYDCCLVATHWMPLPEKPEDE